MLTATERNSVRVKYLSDLLTEIREGMDGLQKKLDSSECGDKEKAETELEIELSQAMEKMVGDMLVKEIMN